VTDSFASILSEARKYRLNLIVAHQYTAQLVTKESSNVRDAIFGNVGTMIVFRVGADDADFLEKEFAPEFTPEDIVNLPNYKVYLKLMIDGITSRPFSAKTIPPMVKGGNKQIEEEVIQSSRDLYCRTKEDIENEINNWSGMSINDGTTDSSVTNGQSSGGNNYSTGPGGERFKATCSTCGKETEVPFKPEPGRPVYCKDCIAKIKSGELKPVKGSPSQMKYDETKFFKPLADLGIEYPSVEYKPKAIKDDRRQGEQKITNEIKSKERPLDQQNKPYPNRPQSYTKPGVIGTIKNVFVKKPTDNRGLKDILNKALEEKAISEVSQAKTTPPTEPRKSEPAPISLSDLKREQPKVGVPTDRSADGNTMNSLKDLLSKIHIEEKPVEKPTAPQAREMQKEQIKPEPPKFEMPKPQPLPIKEPVIKEASPLAQPAFSTSTPITTPTPVPQQREVPEDVLRKILQGEE
jgi:CxxC-x17-CxxC domain-containing protein